MKRLVEFELDDGTPVYVEINEESPREIEKVGGRRGKDTDDPPKGGSFEGAIGRIKPAAEAVLNAFREFNTPDEIALEFGMKIAGKTNAFVFSADTEATFKVALKWANKKPESTA
ncbi:MAG: hypothetical protein GY719_42760 [bacterium]|nr:hypothetical protein [bacterium]